MSCLTTLSALLSLSFVSLSDTDILAALLCSLPRPSSSRLPWRLCSSQPFCADTHCHLDPSPSCHKKIAIPLDASLLASSSLSALAFLLTSAALGVSFDLLSPNAWIARHWDSWQRYLSQRLSITLEFLRGSQEAPVELSSVPYEAPTQDTAQVAVPTALRSSTVVPEASPSAWDRGEEEGGHTSQDPLGVGTLRDISPALASEEEEEVEREEAAWLEREGLAEDFSRPQWLAQDSADAVGLHSTDTTAPLLGRTSSSVHKEKRGRSSPSPFVLEFDYPMYYSFNVTAFCIVLLYAPLAPLTVPAGLAFFLYRLAVDKYNFLFLYRFTSRKRLALNNPSSQHSDSEDFTQWGPSGEGRHVSDKRLLQTVIHAMQSCLCLSLAGLAGVFMAKGDAGAVQCGLLLFVCLLVSVVYLLRGLATHVRVPVVPLVHAVEEGDAAATLVPYEEAATACVQDAMQG